MVTATPLPTLPHTPPPPSFPPSLPHSQHLSLLCSPLFHCLSTSHLLHSLVSFHLHSHSPHLLVFFLFILCPPHSSTLNTPPPSDLPLQLPLWPTQTTTTSPTPLTKKLPPPITALKPSPQGKEGSNRSFRIDYKTFSFSFDGGQADSYAIHECCRNIKSSV